ncbi:MAG: nuclear transport factor 2 family protein [Steroidobacteraceae bacterium]
MMASVVRGMLLAIAGFLPSVGSSAQAAAPTPAARELRELLDAFLEGASRNDVAAHERFWADDLVYTRSAGVRVGKQEILDAVRADSESPGEPPVAYSAEDVRIQQYGDTAVVAFRLVGRAGSGDSAATEHYLNTGTFVRRNGEWRAVAWQATRMPDTGPQRAAPAREAEVNLTPGATGCSTTRAGASARPEPNS